VCTAGDIAHIDTVFKFLPYTCQHVDMVHASNISSCQKNFFGFPVAVNNSIKVGPLVFLFKCL
jgi:hypothetical protein